MERLQELLEGKEVSHILPFLWMKGEGKDRILEELDRIEECGIREICLESRPHPDFCGPGWWETLDFLIPEADRRGMKVWILDDDKFPTGHARGAYETKYPERKKWYLGERHVDLMGPCREGAILTENFLPKDGRLLGILACPKPDTETLAVSGEGILDLTDSCENGFTYFDLPEGAYRLFVLFETQTGGGRADYINLIDSDSVRVLLDEVYEPHYERYRAYFGTTIQGFFSDEPELGNVPGYPFDDCLGQRDQRLPWSSALRERLQSHFGDAFWKLLPALWYDMGERTLEIRSTYMQEMTKLVYQSFSGQLGAWCQEHGVRYIGHVIEDDNAHARMGCSIGHYFREMKGQHMAGVDVVHHQIVPGFTGRIHQWIAGDADGEFFHFGLAKLASSAAHIDPDKRGEALCEIFGNYGWAEGVSLMKWLTNHMLVRGINEFTPHAFSMSYPDRDCPPHFYARGNNPQFPAFAALMKYMNRAAHFLSGGIPQMEAAVLYHAESEWTLGKTMLFQKPVRELLMRQLDCDVIPADCLQAELLQAEEAERLRTESGYPAACVREGRLQIGQQSYSFLILPYAQYLVRNAAEFVIRAAAQGLRVLVVDALPEADTVGRALPEGFAQAVTVVPLAKLADSMLEMASPVVQTEAGLTGLRRLVVSRKEGLACQFFQEQLHTALETRVFFPGRRFVSMIWYDPWNNQAERLPFPEDGGLPLRLEAGESRFVFLEEAADGMTVGKTSETAVKKVVDQPADWGSDLERSGRLREQLTEARLCASWPIKGTWTLTRADELHYGAFQEPVQITSAKQMPNLNGRGFWPAFTGYYRYEIELLLEKPVLPGEELWLYLPEASDSVQIWLNEQDLGILAGFPARIELTGALLASEQARAAQQPLEADRQTRNRLRMECTTTLVWKRKDGASTHLQVAPTGITSAPILEIWKREKSESRAEKQEHSENRV